MCVCVGGGGVRDGGRRAKVLNFKQETSQDSSTKHTVFVAIYISKQKQKDHE